MRVYARSHLSSPTFSFAKTFYCNLRENVWELLRQQLFVCRTSSGEALKCLTLGSILDAAIQVVPVFRWSESARKQLAVSSDLMRIGFSPFHAITLFLFRNSQIKTQEKPKINSFVAGANGH